MSHPYSRLTPERVVAAVESAGRFSDARILPLNSYENRVYQVGLEDGEPVIAKFYRPERWSPEQIDEEHRFTRALFDAEIPVVPPLALDRSDRFPTLGQAGEFYFALYPRQGGRAPELDDLEHLHQLGLYIGRIHAAGRSFPFRYRQRLDFEQARRNAEFLRDAEFVPPDLIAAHRSVCDEILAIVETRRPDSDSFAQISLHGDCHAGNVLWRDERPHFVDFDDALTGPAVQDLWMLLSGDRHSQQRQLADILDGYETFASFDAAELDLVEPLRAMRLLHFNAWLARRWDDPAFPLAFPWFNSPRYWSDHILELKEVLGELQQPPIRLPEI